ncbi:hypothetical protein R5R35_008021 [Gryllus longicercus]|uniref:DNA/RNA-binding protein Alba-like domain-containing protein n=1 Tax=Gryllus longicercus TaxID=2509291 RepID=A0AAN9VAP6_9ORTH
MENYRKGKNVEEQLEREKIPIPGLPSEFIWMQVSGGSKMRNLLGYAMNAFQDQKAIVWSGSGPAVSKTISCAEIVKRRYKHVHQINKICYRRVEEYWEPLLEDLDPLVVVRDVPTIHILLSKEPLDSEEPGYQPSSTQRIALPSKKVEHKGNNQSHRKPRTHCVLGQFAPKASGSSKKSQKSVNDAVSPKLSENQTLDREANK